MAFKKKDFIELEFTAKVKGGEVFDSNIAQDLKDVNIKGNPKPFVFPLGEGMFLKGVDDFLIGKDVGEYNIELKPEDAFGKRNPSLLQLVPKKIFLMNKINPIVGNSFNIDNRIAKILSVSGGRILVDFNNPIAGKFVKYKLIVKRKVEDLNEKINAINEFLLGQKIDFEIKDKNLILKLENKMKPFAELFKDKYLNLLDLNLKIEEKTSNEPNKK